MEEVPGKHLLLDFCFVVNQKLLTEDRLSVRGAKLSLKLSAITTAWVTSSSNRSIF